MMLLHAYLSVQIIHPEAYAALQETLIVHTAKLYLIFHNLLEM